MYSKFFPSKRTLRTETRSRYSNTMPPVVCVSFKANGLPCTVNSSRRRHDTHPEHLHLCGTHKNTYSTLQTALGGHHTPGRCLAAGRRTIEGDDNRHVVRWCQHPAIEGGILCAAHELRRTTRLARARPPRAEIVRTLLNGFLEQDPLRPWDEVARVLVHAQEFTRAIRLQVAAMYYQAPQVGALEGPEWAARPLWRFNLYWRWVEDGQGGFPPNVNQQPVLPGPVPAPGPPGLAAIARDHQNVHTRVVSQQTNDSTAKLLAMSVPETQHTEKTLAKIWVSNPTINYSRFLQVVNDINRWFNTKDCRVVGDNLYRRLLRGLVANILSQKDIECKSELFRRLWEECYESVGMCCEGHISRLCNVLVGFDESFKPPVAFGEILQSKMAMIAGLDIAEEEKRRQANAFFDEYGTPAEERAAWLEAF